MKIELNDFIDGVLGQRRGKKWDGCVVRLSTLEAKRIVNKRWKRSAEITFIHAPDAHHHHLHSGNNFFN